MKRFTNGVRASRAGRDAAIIWPGHSKMHRDVSAREIAEHHSRKEGRDAVGSFLYEGSMHGFQGLQPTKSRANVHADAVRHALRDGQTRVLHGFLTRCQGKVDEAIHAAHVAFVDIVLRSKIRHFPGNLGRIRVRVKAGNLADARYPLTELFPAG